MIIPAVGTIVMAAARQRLATHTHVPRPVTRGRGLGDVAPAQSQSSCWRTHQGKGKNSDQHSFYSRSTLKRLESLCLRVRS